MDDDVSRRVALEVADGIATVRLDRPEKLNALDPVMFEALVTTGTALVDRDDVGAVRIVAPDAQLSVMEVQRGLVPDMCGTQLLPELVGRDVAKELALPGRTVSGAEAVRMGLDTRAADDPLAEAQALTAELAGHSRSATRAVKRLVELSGRVPLAEGLAAEQDEIGALIGSPEQVAVVRHRLGA